MKTMILTRGWPGSGKSYLSKQIAQKAANNNIRCETFSTDNYWMQNGDYIFNPTKLSIAHKWNQDNVRFACEEKLGFAKPELVIVDNTNLTFKELIPYLNIAKKNNYIPFEVVPNTPWMYNIQECVDRNQHGVPSEAIERMMKKFEPNLQARIMEYILCQN